MLCFVLIYSLLLNLLCVWIFLDKLKVKVLLSLVHITVTLPDEDLLKVNRDASSMEHFTHAGHELRSHPIAWDQGHLVVSLRV